MTTVIIVITIAAITIEHIIVARISSSDNDLKILLFVVVMVVPLLSEKNYNIYLILESSQIYTQVCDLEISNDISRGYQTFYNFLS